MYSNVVNGGKPLNNLILLIALLCCLWLAIIDDVMVNASAAVRCLPLEQGSTGSSQITPEFI